MKVDPIRVIAINPKHQSAVNKYNLLDAKYATIVNENGDAGGPKQEHAYNKAAEILGELPAREQANIKKVSIAVKGYF
jgi:hypothetical protein